MIVVGDWCRGGSFETGNVVLQFCLRLERSSKGVTHFLVLQFGFLEFSDETCTFINVVAVGAGGIQSTGGSLVGILSELWLNDLLGLKPGILPGGCSCSKIFGL